jgi:ABC-type branched-subunit amino acid transport system ATPase component
MTRSFLSFGLLGGRSCAMSFWMSFDGPMLALAPALVRPPAVFVADEPSLGLAPMASEAVFEALELADVVAVMELGHIVWTGPRGDADADRLAATYLSVRV